MMETADFKPNAEYGVDTTHGYYKFLRREGDRYYFTNDEETIVVELIKEEGMTIKSVKG